MGDEIVDIISTENGVIPIESCGEAPIDILNRQPFIDQTIKLIEILSSKKSACTFALTGKWGSGKTFVLNVLEQQLRDYQAGEKYLVFHYNCWQYDYYEEPVIAIVSAMLDSISDQTKLLTHDTRETLKSALMVAKSILESIVGNFVKNKIGIDIIETVESAFTAANEKKKRAHEYDTYYAFKAVLEDARESLTNLASTQTVVVVVDELDRCLPDYAIRVLERLHHLFDGIRNIEIILSVDKKQLDNTVKQIFGEDTDTDTYLKKFINFEIALDSGEINSSFKEKYRDYIEMFDPDLIKTSFSLDDYFAALFDGIDIRTQERLMERIKIVHTILFINERKDYSVMCFEVMWLVFSEYYNIVQMPINVNNGLVVKDDKLTAFSRYMKTQWSSVAVRHDSSTHRDEGTKYFFPNPLDIPQLTVWYLQHMYESKKYLFQLQVSPTEFPKYQKTVEDLLPLPQLLRIIK